MAVRGPSAWLVAAFAAVAGPPTGWGELAQLHDDRDVFQASPNELPAIDIHRL